MDDINKHIHDETVSRRQRSGTVCVMSESSGQVHGHKQMLNAFVVFEYAGLRSTDETLLKR